MTLFSKHNVRASKLTPEMVIWGREQYRLHLETRGMEGMNMRQLANLQQVSRETVARYIRGESWQGLEQGLNNLAEQRDQIAQRMAPVLAPSTESAEIQGSLARLSRLIGTGAGPSSAEAHLQEPVIGSESKQEQTDEN
jgi:hypothetical protein